MLRISKNEDQSMLRLSEDVNIKYYNIINSRKTNQKLIENITIESQKKWGPIYAEAV